MQGFTVYARRESERESHAFISCDKAELTKICCTRICCTCSWVQVVILAQVVLRLSELGKGSILFQNVLWHFVPPVGCVQWSEIRGPSYRGLSHSRHQRKCHRWPGPVRGRCQQRSPLERPPVRHKYSIFILTHYIFLCCMCVCVFVCVCLWRRNGVSVVGWKSIGVPLCD